jgi:hypothetical protein
MTPIKYLCIDDAEESVISTYTEKVERFSEDRLLIEVIKPLLFKDILASIIKIKPDGLIIDLRLDELPYDENGNTVDYRGTTLAQELRTRMGEGEIEPIPIVIWSVDTNFLKSYTHIRSAQDICDQVYEKDQFVSRYPGKVAEQLIDLSGGYKKIKELSRDSTESFIYELLGLDASGEGLDPRIGIELDQDPKFPAHEFASYLIGNVVRPRGVLIEEAVLASRLGVDIQSGDWNALKDRVEEVKYSGVFSEIWPRWWARRLDEWWFSLEGVRASLQSLSAQERVRIIKENTELENLQSSQPIEEEYSTKYWTICEASRRPIDPADAYMISSSQSPPWVESQFVSSKALLDRTAAREGIRLHPLERERFNVYKLTLIGRK